MVSPIPVRRPCKVRKIPKTWTVGFATKTNAAAPAASWQFGRRRERKKRLLSIFSLFTASLVIYRTSWKTSGSQGSHSLTLSESIKFYWNTSCKLVKMLLISFLKTIYSQKFINYWHIALHLCQHLVVKEATSYLTPKFRAIWFAFHESQVQFMQHQQIIEVIIIMLGA